MSDHEKDKRIIAFEEWASQAADYLYLRFFNARLKMWTSPAASELHAAALALIGEHRPEGRTEHGAQ